MEPRLDRAAGPPEPFGDVVDFQVRPEAKDDDGAEVDIEDVHRGQQVVLPDELVVRIAGLVPNGFVHHSDAPDDSRPPQAVAADVHEDSVEPGLEACRIAQRIDTVPRAKVGIVGRVLRIVEAAENQAGESVGSVELVVGNSREPILRSWRRSSGQRCPLPSFGCADTLQDD